MGCSHDPYEDKCDDCQVCLGCDAHRDYCGAVQVIEDADAPFEPEAGKVP